MKQFIIAEVVLLFLFAVGCTSVAQNYRLVIPGEKVVFHHPGRFGE